MEWQLERQSFRELTPTLNKNSQLKKKMLFVKRIKNLDSTNIQTLIPELMKENMEQFYTEIISTVLSIKPTNSEDIKNVIRVLAVYLKDYKFVSLILNSITKNVTECYGCIYKYWYLILYIEIKSILDPGFDGMFYFKEFYLKGSVEVKILLLEYLVDFWESKDIFDKEISKIKNYKINLDKTFLVERMERVCGRLGIEFLGDRKRENEFKAIIVPNENEFDWYVIKNENVEIYEGGFGLKEVVEYIKKNFNDSTRVDGLCRALKQAENLRMIPGIINKLKSNICYYPVLARILKSIGAPGKKFTNKLVEDFYGLRRGCVLAHNRCDIVNSLVLLSELIKFKTIPSSEVFGLLDHFLKIKDIELYCLLLKNVGRFYLLDEVTNCKTREYLDKGINFGNRCNSLECLYINDMVCRIFPNRRETKLEDFQNFISFYFQKETFNEEGDAWNILKRNRRFLFMVFLKPWDFKDLNHIAFLIDKANLVDPVIDFILVLFKSLSRHSKMKTIAFAKLLGKTLKYKKTILQEDIVRSILSLEIERNMKIRILANIMKDASFYVKQKYLGILRREGQSTRDLEIHNIIFNLCEEMGEKYEESPEEDSFEEELRYMKTV